MPAPEQISLLNPLPNPLTGTERYPISQDNGGGYTTYYANPGTPQTPAEFEAGVVPTYPAYPAGDPRRYGAVDVTAGGTTDSTAALAASVSVIQNTNIPTGTTFLTTGGLAPVAGATINGSGTLKLSGGNNAIIAITNSNISITQVGLDAAAGSLTSKVGVSIGGTASNITVADCTFTQARILELGTATTNIHIQRNYCTGSCVGGTGGGTIQIGSSVACVDWDVRDNTVDNSDGCGIAVANASLTGIVSGNLVRGNAGPGIWIEAADNCTVTGNICVGGLSTGIGWNYGGTPFPQRSTIANNVCVSNVQDGIDINVGSGASTAYCYVTVTGNYCASNGLAAPYGCGINVTYASLSAISNNICFGNGLHGIDVYGGTGNAINGNLCISNGSVTPGTTYQGIALISATSCVLHGNICTNLSGSANQQYGIAESGAANSNVISGNNCIGNVTGTVYASGATTVVRDDMGGYSDQSFALTITNTAGTLQHVYTGNSGSNALGNLSSRVLNGTATLTNTPTGTDATTAMANGGKISSANTNNFIVDTSPQSPVYTKLSANICYDDTVAAGSVNGFIQVRPQILSIDVNGVTQYRLVFNFFNAGTPFALTTANIPSGKSIQVQFNGCLS